MKTEKPEKLISVPEKTFLRMVLRLTKGRNLFPEKVEGVYENQRKRVALINVGGKANRIQYIKF